VKPGNRWPHHARLTARASQFTPSYGSVLNLPAALWSWAKAKANWWNASFGPATWPTLESGSTTKPASGNCASNSTRSVAGSAMLPGKP